jgi:hypothetical protein
MRNRFWLLALVIAVVVLGSHVSQSDETSTVAADKLPDADVKSTTDSLRAQYLELVKTKALLMDEETLRKEIVATQEKIDELQAAKQLAEAEQLLRELAEQHPNSPAAQVANQMLLVPKATRRESRSPDSRDNWDRSGRFSQDLGDGFDSGASGFPPADEDPKPFPPNLPPKDFQGSSTDSFFPPSSSDPRSNS